MDKTLSNKTNKKKKTNKDKTNLKNKSHKSIPLLNNTLQDSKNVYLKE